MRKLTWVPCLIAFSLCSCVTLLAGDALAEAGRTGARRTGFEVALHGSNEAIVGRTYALRGTAYEVYGVADLRPRQGLRVRARYEARADEVAPGPWSEVAAGTGGRFVLDVAIPANAHGTSRLEIVVGRGDDLRELEIPLTLRSPFIINLRTDRNLYEPGETAHVWARLRDRASLRPVADVPLNFTVSHGENHARRRITTGAGGVGSYTFEIPESADEGGRQVRVAAEQGGVHGRASADFRVGRRDVERFFVTVEATPEQVAPQGEVTLHVEARTPSGSPIRGARVHLEMENRTFSGETDSSGVFELHTRAPAFLTNSTGWVRFTAGVFHPAYGSLNRSGGFRLALPLTLRIDAIELHGGLVPEVNDEILLSVLDVLGEPPEAGTPVEVTGPTVRGRTHTYRGTTDSHGFVTVPMFAPRSAASRHRGGPCSNRTATTIDVAITGPRPRAARLCVPVAAEALVVPTVAQRVLEPGATTTVAIARRPAVARNAVAIDLIHRSGNRLITTVVVPAGRNEAELTIPQGHLGILLVRARPLAVEGAAQGAGAVEPIIVRPPHPFFPTVESDHEVYQVRGTARLTIRTAPEAGPGFVALLTRDLAAHAGESNFANRFLARSFDDAVLDPEEADAGRLIRAALATVAQADVEPNRAPPLEPGDLSRRNRPNFNPQAGQNRGDLRDPRPLGDELRRRGIGPTMVALERALYAALRRGTIEELTVGTGPRRRFRDDALARAFQGRDLPENLGGEPLDVAMLTAEDPSFTYDAVARRIARRRLMGLTTILSGALQQARDPAQRPVLDTVPPERWLSRLVQEGMLRRTELVDPWGHPYVLRRAAARRPPVFPLAPAASDMELISPGPDGRPGTADDVRDPFVRIVPRGTPYAVASGEDRLMATLASVSPGPAALEAIRQAYQRRNAEAREEEVGDAAEAGASEDASNDGLYASTIGLGDLATIGHGGGGGSGSGYGRGAGGLRGRRSSVPRIRTGRASVTPGGGRGVLSDIMRERFPATLQFIAEVALDPSGATEVELPLAHAVTTYRIEAVVWTANGWTWPARHEIRVEQDLVADAPVPAVATVGDELQLPLFVASRRSKAARLRLELEASPELGLEKLRTAEVVVPPGESRSVPAKLVLTRPGSGALTISAWAGDGDRPLDAARRPLLVQPDHRRVRDRAQTIIDTQGSLELVVPDGASPLGRSQITLAEGAALFHGSDWSHPGWEAWAEAQAGRDLDNEVVDELLEELPEADGEADTLDAALAAGALWRNDSAPDDRIRGVLLGLTNVLSDLRQRLARQGSEPEPGAVSQLSTILLVLSPAIHDARRRPALRQDLSDLVQIMRRTVEESSVQVTESPWLWANAAAALAWSTPGDTPNRRAQELLRRIRPAVTGAGEDLWLEGGTAEESDQLRQGTAMLALAELRLGDRRQALRLVSTLARMARAAEEPYGPRPCFDSNGNWGPARAAAALLTAGPGVDAVTLTIDGEEQQVELEEGVAEVESEALGRPGRHQVQVTAPQGAVVLITAGTSYGLPWDVGAERPGPLALTIEGTLGSRDQYAGLTLEVRNRSPRLIAAPVVEVYLPAGAELEQAARTALNRRTARPMTLADRVLTLTLPPLTPGASRELDLPFRWSVSGRLRGLGAVGFATDRPRDVSILPSRQVDIGESSDASSEQQGGAQ